MMTYDGVYTYAPTCPVCHQQCMFTCPHLPALPPGGIGSLLNSSAVSSAMYSVDLPVHMSALPQSRHVMAGT